MWFELFVVTLFFLLGHIFFGHFDERSPAWRKLLKYVVTVAVVLALSHFFGRAVAFAALGLALLPVIYVHGYWLPRHGVNGLTGEPREKYYELRGWN